MQQSITETDFPSEKRSALERALTQAFGTTQWDSLTLLTGGYSSALVYKIVVGNRPYLLRLVTEINALSDPARQYICMDAAAQAGIAPQVHYTSVEDALSITDFIATKPLREAFGSPDLLRKELVKTIKSIHALPLFPPLVNFLDGIDLFIQQFHESHLLPETATQEHFRYYAEIQQAYPRHDPDLVASHNDLNPNNILFDGERLWVIDWEAAFRNDRYVDLANVANAFVTDAAQEETYLTEYFGDALDDTKRARFFLMRQVCFMFYAMILMNFAAASRQPGTPVEVSMESPSLREFFTSLTEGRISINTYGGRLLMGKVYLNEALRQMKTPRFAEAIQIMTDHPISADGPSPR